MDDPTYNTEGKINIRIVRILTESGFEVYSRFSTYKS